MHHTPWIAIAFALGASACGANGSGLPARSLATSGLQTPGPGKLGAQRMSGRLPPSLIQSTVRNRYTQMGACYGQGLGRDPNIRGRITIRFVIEQDGAVRRVRIDDSSLQDADVLRCVVAEFYRLRFPEPDGGIVTVVYPLMLTPVDD